MANKPESDAFLAGIDAKIAALQQFRESYLKMRAAGVMGLPPDPSSFPAPPGGSNTHGSQQTSQTGGPVDLPTGIFRDKGLADALRLYLTIAKRKQTFKEIKAALMEGGLATTAEYFDQTLNGTMHRMRRKGELLQFKDGWDLADSYPPGMRQRLSEANEQPKRKKKKPRQKADAATAKSQAKATAEFTRSVLASKSTDLIERGHLKEVADAVLRRPKTA
jgi:hypothetical protein